MSSRDRNRGRRRRVLGHRFWKPGVWWRRQRLCRVPGAPVRERGRDVLAPEGPPVRGASSELGTPEKTPPPPSSGPSPVSEGA
ncbi:hypothetical protein CapIbe_016608 [Capra ibex]